MVKQFQGNILDLTEHVGLIELPYVVRYLREILQELRVSSTELTVGTSWWARAFECQALSSVHIATAYEFQ